MPTFRLFISRWHINVLVGSLG
uniref:Uncharacterized protein n=1 Tax=Arundo donax TaxID=35708 RepID=A0A0A8ZIF8_ARUDO